MKKLIQVWISKFVYLQAISKKIYILILITIGFFMIPSISFACGAGCGTKKTESKETCNSDKHSKQQTTKNGCCSTRNQSKHGNRCGGKCKHNSCHCTAPVLSLILTSFSELTLNRFDFYNQKKNFNIEQSNISSGFYYIWTPPNIG